MATPPWFYYPFDEIETSTFQISGAEVRHITSARRLQVEDQLILMNGEGKLAHCMLDEFNKKAQTLSLRVSLVAEIEQPKVKLQLSVALPKGDRFSSMLDMVCQLGATHITPINFKYSVSRWSDKLKGRAERILIEAAKQSKRAWVPTINDVKTFDELLSEQNEASKLVFLADQFGQSLHSYSAQIESAHQMNLVVGPEGGLCDRERTQALTHGFEPLKLAEPILRIETAAVAGIAALSAVRPQHNSL